MSDDYQALNAELNRRIAVDTASMEWTPSPGGHVLRRRIHLCGEPESGQVTSVVRYLPESRFPAHDHPQGEEILVLDGVFSDEHGDWPAGSYLLNPEGFRHSPFSREGCTLFVKLRQYPDAQRRHVALQTRELPWLRSVRKNCEWKKLYAQEPYTDSMRIERWQTPAELGRVNFPQGAELFVLRGAFSDDFGEYPTHCWLRVPAGGFLVPRGEDACELYIKEGGFTYLEGGPEQAV